MDIVTDCSRAEIGGKASGLCRLRRLCAVPSFFVVVFANPGEVDDPSCQSEIVAECARHGFSSMAVRSSASVEDGREASFAGMFRSFLGVTPRRLLGAVRDVLDAVDQPRVVEYMEALSLHCSAISMSVIVQRMVDSRVSGVCLTRTPTAQTTTIEAVYGLAEPLVAGGVTPDRYVVNRRTHTIESCVPGYQSERLVLDPSEGTRLQGVAFYERNARKLSAEEVSMISRQCVHIERELGLGAVDVEWAIESSELLVLQARPVCRAPWTETISHEQE